MVRRLLRLLGPLLGLVLFLQLQLVGSGYVCQSASGARAEAASMAGMTMRVPGLDAPAQSPSATHAPGRHDRAPCRFPWAPTGCRDMAPCAPAALPAAVAVLTPAAMPARVADPVLVAAAPASPSRPPELPPPRA